MTNAASQSCRILAHMQAGHSITPLQALTKFHCFRLGARIWDIRQAGIKVHKETITLVGAHGQKTRIARYSIEAKK